MYSKTNSGSSRYRVNVLLQRARFTLALMRKKQRLTMTSGSAAQTGSTHCKSRLSDGSFGASPSSTQFAAGDNSVTPRSLSSHSSFSSRSTRLADVDSSVTPRSLSCHSTFGSRPDLAQLQSDRSSANISPVSSVVGDSSNGSTIGNTTWQSSRPVSPAFQTPATSPVPLSQPCNEELLDVDLISILRKHALGQALVMKKELDGATRDLLVAVLADHMIVTYQRPSKRHYLSYSHAVKQMFKQESLATYYTPSFNQKPPKGKLYCKVTNVLARRVRLGMTTPGSKRTGRNDEPTMLAALDDDTDEDNVEDMVAWLSVHQPQSKLLDYWRKTAKLRLNYIHGDTMPDINTVCAAWPRYCDAKGFLLVGEDFTRLYAGKEDKLSSGWAQVYEKVLDKVGKLKTRDKILDKMVKSLKEEGFTESSNEIKMTAAVFALPLLLPEACVAVKTKPGNRKRSTWKPTVVETMTHFIDVQKPGIDLQRYIEEKAALLQRYDLHIQPHVVVISSDDLPVLRDGSLSYAVISGRLWYRTTSTLEAVDVCMKAAFVFGIKFPDAIHSSWLFLQKALYQITTKFDSAPTKVLELISDLNLTG